MQWRPQRRNEMERFTDETSKTATELYLPAVAPEPDFRRIGERIGDLLDFHGVVLIPESYNE